MIDAKTAKAILSNYDGDWIEENIQDEIICAAKEGRSTIFLRGSDIIHRIYTTDLANILVDECGYDVKIHEDCVEIGF